MKTLSIRPISIALGLTAASIGVRAEAPSKASAAAAFGTIYKVLQSPRCVNCHIKGDSPLQGDAGTPHTQNVVRGPEGKGVPGLACTDCHGAANVPASYGPAMPPGAPGWHLPPPEMKMVFQLVSKRDLCASLKDPKRNGGRTLEAIASHLESDPLVLWGWSPGEGRGPVPIAHDELVNAVKAWIGGGAPCPATGEATALPKSAEGSQTASPN